MSKLSKREQKTKYAAIAQSVERILGKDEVASSNLASSSKPLKLLAFQGLFLFLPKSHDLILHIKILIRDEVIIMKKIEMPTGESKDFLEVIAVLGNDLSLQALVSFSGYFLVDNFISHVRQPPI